MRKALKSWTPEGATWMKKFTFECWVVPHDNDELTEKLNSDTYFDTSGWVFKPESGGGGSGIYVAMDKAKVENDIKWWKKRRQTYVIQPRLANPLLIKNRKFDLRTHVLVTSVSPIRAYLHSNGIVRFASGDFTKEYSKDTRNSFLTNLSVGGKTTKTEDLSWSFEELRAYLKEDAALVFSRIDEAIAKMLVASEKAFSERYSSIDSGNFKCRTCYQQIGVDILLDEDLKPYIMEVNGNPMQNFKSEKITQVCKEFQSDISALLYGDNSNSINNDLIEALESVLSPGMDLDSYYDWLDSDSIEYLLMMLTEQMNMESFRLVYPSSHAAYSKTKEIEWTTYLDYLQHAPERIAFHKLLVNLQRERVSKCLDFEGDRCSAEVYDIKLET